MQKSQMATIEMPKQLTPQGDVKKEMLRGVLVGGGDTNTHLKWNTLNYAGAVSTAAFIGLNIATGFEALFLTLSILAGVATAGSLFVNSIVFLCIGNRSLRKFNTELRELARPIENGELKWRTSNYDINGNPTYKTTQGFRIKQKTRKFIRPHFFLPLRIFRKQLISETTWYNPNSDVYLKKTIYLKANSMVRETETYVGSRYTFRKALESL
jgi:hypothetical protein